MNEKLIATKRLVYNARTLQVGEEFQASTGDADVLVTIGSAKRADAPAVMRKLREYKRRDLKAEE